MNQSLSKENPKLKYVSFLLFLALTFLILGLFLPAIYLKEMVVFRHTFSVLTGIQNLFHEGQSILGIIIILFSVIFPIFKLFVLYVVWFHHVPQQRRSAFIHWLSILGKWSMLDVFVVAVTIVITQVSHFAAAEPKSGIYFFCASILITMLITAKIEKIIKKS
ncbi:MAG: paraquat-inducible protein A [Candidatus Omnitrophica bacterium]|nr:paraquat-inducible protein A [Candidatus Omnitrophota bacterium]